MIEIKDEVFEYSRDNLTYWRDGVLTVLGKYEESSELYDKYSRLFHEWRETEQKFMRELKKE